MEKTIILDIETSPLVVLVWDVGEQYVRHDQILKDWDIMSWSAKELGKPEHTRVYYDRRNSLSDLQILKPLRDLLDESRIVITQNGKKFDSRKITARFIEHKLTPPSPYTHIDTYVMSKTIAAFTSHSLDYMTEKLNTKYKKLSHSEYPGLTLWKECLSIKIVEQPWKNPHAWNVMKKYNIHDVLSTEEMYVNLRPYSPKNTPKVFSAPAICSVCGHKAERRGTEMKGKTTVQRTRCKSTSCGKWGTEPLPKKETI